MPTKPLSAALVLAALLAACGTAPIATPSATTTDAAPASEQPAAPAPAMRAQSVVQEDEEGYVAISQSGVATPLNLPTLDLQGALRADDVLERQTIENACDVYVSKPYWSNRMVTKSCYFPAPQGWAIMNAEVQVTENFKGRGSYEPQTFAQGQTFTYNSSALSELKASYEANIKAALDKQNYEVAAKIQEEYRQFLQAETALNSSHNFFRLNVTADGGRMSYSRIRVLAKVHLVRTK